MPETPKLLVQDEIHERDARWFTTGLYFARHAWGYISLVMRGAGIRRLVKHNGSYGLP